MLVGSVATAVRRTMEVGAWTCVAGFSAIVFVGSALTPIPGAAERVCRGSSPRVCTDRAHATVLAEFSSVASDAVQVLPPRLRPEVLDDSARPAPPGVLAFAPVDGVVSPALTVDRDETVAALGQAIFGACDQERPPGVEEPLAASTLEVWWRSANGISVDQPVTPGGAPWLSVPELASARDAGLSLSALSADAQRTWFEQNGRLIAECRTSEVRWP